MVVRSSWLNFLSSGASNTRAMNNRATTVMISCHVDFNPAIHNSIQNQQFNPNSLLTSVSTCWWLDTGFGLIITFLGFL
jgi:hypothetical protein